MRLEVVDGMFRVFVVGALGRASRCILKKPTPIKAVAPSTTAPLQTSKFSTLCTPYVTATPSLLNNPQIKNIGESITRNVVKFSLKKGKRKSVKAVLRRFYRLDWGGWIRTKAGRNKKLWRKHAARKRRLRQHVLCNSTQSYMLDKMVGPYWRRPKYYVDDPYEPYHTREEFAFTYKNPI